MKKQNQLLRSDIVFFEIPKEKYQTCQLKNYIHFLSYQKIRRPFRFAHIQSEGEGLLPALTLKENIQLDSSALNFMHDRYQDLEKKIKNTFNPHLEKLLQLIGELECYPSQTSCEIKKLTNLTKGLLQSADFLLLECPELHLSSKSLEIFIMAMHHKCQYSGQIALISSPHGEVWKDIATKTVSRNEDKTFSIETIDNSKVKSLNDYRKNQTSSDKKDQKDVA